MALSLQEEEEEEEETPLTIILKWATFKTVFFHSSLSFHQQF